MSNKLLSTDNANLSTTWSGLLAKRLVMTDDSLYLLDLNESFWATVVGQQFGVLGYLITNSINSNRKKKALQSFEQKTEDEILATSPKHLKITYNEVNNFKIADGGLKNLSQRFVTLEVNGKKYKIFITSKDDFDNVVGLLRQFLREKEQT